MKLYHYVHCPFCVRVRMALGYLNKCYESVVLNYDDEVTPKNLTGVKMLPIFEFDDGSAINESLEIIKRHDRDDKLNTLQSIVNYENIEVLLNKIGADVHNLAMPYWIWTPEFNDDSRSYFQAKKEVKRGPFKNLVTNRQTFVEQLNQTLALLENDLSPFYKSNQMTLDDILIASHLWGMYIVPEFQFTAKVHSYLQSVAAACNFKYHKDFWE